MWNECFKKKNEAKALLFRFLRLLDFFCKLSEWRMGRDGDVYRVTHDN